MGYGGRSLENLVSADSSAPFGGFYLGKRVLVTGHTGFKGGWLTMWLHSLGASVHGYALDPSTDPGLFEAAAVGRVLGNDIRADLADLGRLRLAFDEVKPEMVFHLAAQPLVRASYQNPLGTFATNVMGTANVLETARSCGSVRAVIAVTTDKVYQNREWDHPYREVDPLGGHDPYSASKAAAEIVAAGYRASFFESANGHPARIVTARAGNVIGGGDWSPDRLIPDCLVAFSKRAPVRLRFPDAVRPWQHVLEPLSGYLQLARLACSSDGSAFARAWNFGPGPDGDATVGNVAQALARLWGPEARVEIEQATDHPHEAGLLRLDSTLARTKLGWRPRWSLEKALSRTIEWHKAWAGGAAMDEITLAQIADYMGEGT